MAQRTVRNYENLEECINELQNLKRAGNDGEEGWESIKIEIFAQNDIEMHIIHKQTRTRR